MTESGSWDFKDRRLDDEIELREILNEISLYTQCIEHLQFTVRDVIANVNIPFVDKESGIWWNFLENKVVAHVFAAL